MDRVWAKLRDERGMTLIELVVSLTVFAILIGSVSLSMNSTLNLTRGNRNRSIGANLASAEIDAVRSLDFMTLPIGRVQTNKVLDNVTYKVIRDTEWVSLGAQTGPCDGSTTSTPSVVRVSIEIQWPSMSGMPPVRSQTIITPPAASFDPNKGHIAVKLIDRNGLAAAGHNVKVTGSGPTLNQTTTSGGCAFFAFLTPATYTVELNTTNYVDGQSNASPVTRQVVVTAAATSPVGFEYDQKATLTLTIVPDSAGVSIPANIPVAVYNPKLLPIGTKSYAGTGSPRTIGSLFPYLDGYQYWMGNCVDSDQEGQKPGGGGPFYVGATRQAALEAIPNGTSAGNVTIATVEVTVMKGATPQSGKSLTAFHLSDASCSIATPANAGMNLTLPGTTNASGKLKVAVPYGIWQFRVTGSTPTGGPGTCLPLTPPCWKTFTVSPVTPPAPPRPFTQTIA